MPPKPKSSDVLTQREWQDAENWSGPDWMALYFSKRDPRLWVPKRIPWMGLTLNLGHPSGPFWLIVLLAGIPTGIMSLLVVLLLLAF